MKILLEDITIQLGAQTLFDHTTWNINDKQNWALVGRTGSGKSTLINAICHKSVLKHGKIHYLFDGEDQSRSYFYPGEILTLSSETHQKFLNRYADYHQARWQSIEGDEVPVVSDVLSSASINNRSKYEVSSITIDEESYQERRRYVVDLFRIKPLLYRKIIHLSHGESRKVFLARLLMQNPKLLIMDSPFTGLDQESKDILKQGIEILLQHSDQKILMATSRSVDLCKGITHLLVVDQNQIIAQGEIEKILHKDDLKSILFPDQLSLRKGSVEPCKMKVMVDKYSRDVEQKYLDEKTSVLFSMENVSVNYDGESVLQDISWQVLKNERWALFGHNGAGKSTLISLIMADNPQSYANAVTLFGIKRGSGESIWQIKKNIGWVSPELHIYYQKQVNCLNVVCSGFFNSNGLHYSCSHTQIMRVIGWMNAMGIENLKSRSFDDISTGQQRLVLLARALVNHPPLLILDEPCQTLDDLQRKNFIEILNHLCFHTSVAIVYVTHERDEIPAFFNHILSLDHGKIVQCT